MSGQQSSAIAGCKKEGTYGTGVAVTGAAARYLPFISENITARRTPIASKGQQGSGGARQFIGDGPVEAGGPLVEHARYDLSTDPLHPLLEQIFGLARGHVYRKTLIGSGNTVSWVKLRAGAADNVMLACNFTPAVTGSADITVRLRLRRRGAPTGNVQVLIDGNSAGDPDETPIANGTATAIDVTAITADDNGQELEFTFASSPTLTASTVLHCRLIGTFTASATVNVELAVEDVASGGNLEIKDSAWADDTTKNVIGRILTSSFIDTYLMARTHEGNFASLAIDKGQRVHQWSGVKATKLTVASAPRDGVTLAHDLIAAAEQASGSVSTTAANLAGLKNTRTHLLHTDLTCRIGAQAAVLAAGDNVAVSAAEFSAARPADAEIVSGADTITEPLENAERDVMLKVTVPRYAVNTYKTWAIAKTAVQAWLQWASGGKYWTLLLPNLHVMGDVEIPTDGKKAYAQTISLQAYTNEGENDYMNVHYEAELTILQ